MLQVPFKVAFRLTRQTSLAVKSVDKPWSHSWPIEIRLRSPKAGKMFDLRAPKGSWGKGKRAVWDAQIYDVFGRPTRVPFEVKDFFVLGVVGPIKWLLHTESTMAGVMRTNVRGGVVFATFSL